MIGTSYYMIMAKGFEKLIADVRSGDERKRDKALKQIYLDKNLEGKSFGMLHKMGLKTQEEKLGIFQEAFIILVNNIETRKYKGGSLISYFLAICKNTGLNKIKDKKKHETNEEIQPTSAINSDSPDRILERSEEEEILEALTNKLSPRCQEILGKKYKEDFSSKQIALEVGVKEQSIRNKLYQCKKKLRELIKGDPELIALLKPKV